MSDLISRQAAIDALHMDTSIIPFKKAREYADVTISEIRNRLEKLPSAQPERIKARWLPVGMAYAVGGESAMWGDEIAYHACDNCWQQALEKDGEEVLSDFCPNCGAEMREVTT